MASTDFPEMEPIEEEQPVGAEDTQPSLQDFSTEDLWDLNRKLLYASEHYDQRVMNLNQKTVADAQAQAVFWQQIQERSEALKLAAQERKERQDLHAINMQRAWQSVDHQATLNSAEYANARGIAVLGARTIEPKETLDTVSETIADAAAKGAQIGARAMADSGQTSIGNLAGYSAVRQVADVNSINTLAAYQALSNQMAELALAVQALTGNQPKAE